MVVFVKEKLWSAMEQNVRSALENAGLPHMPAKSIDYVLEGVSFEERYTIVFKREKQKVFRYIMVVLNDQGEAEDATQTVFLKYWRSGEKIPHDKIHSWLFTVARHEALDILRKKRPVFLEQDEDEDIHPLEKIEPQAGFEDHICNNSLVWQILSQLSQLQRLCFILKEGYELKPKEIADILCIPKRRVAYHYKTALGKAQRVWRDLKAKI